MYSSKNYVTVEEEALAQFDYIFKQLLLGHQEYHSLLEDDEKLADEEWFEEADERVFTSKHKVYNWLKEGKSTGNPLDYHTSCQYSRKLWSTKLTIQMED